MTIRARITVCAFLLVLVTAMGSWFSLRQVATVSDAYGLRTGEALERKVFLGLQGLQTFTARSEALAVTLAAVGVEFYTDHPAVDAQALEIVLQERLGRLLQAHGPQSGFYGLCLAYQPRTILPDVDIFDPYAFWEGDKVGFVPATSENYFILDWYTTALPQGWDVQQRRPKSSYWTAPYIAEDTGALLVSVTAPMYTSEGTIIGVGLADVSLTFMESMLRSVMPMKEAQGIIVHVPSNTIVSATSDSALQLKPLTALPFAAEVQPYIQKLADNQQISVQFTFDGQEWLGSFASMGGDMVVGFLMPRALVYAESDTMRRESFILSICSMVGILLLLLGVGYYLLVRVVSPVSALARYAEKVTSGDYTNSIQGVFVAELQTLRTALLTMVSDISHRMTLAQEHAQAMEQQGEQVRVQMALVAEASSAASAQNAAMQTVADKLVNIIHAVAQDIDRLADLVHRSDAGAEEQSAKLLSTATAMEEMNNTVLEVARSAASTAELTMQTRQQALEAVQVVRQSIEGIHSVERQALTLKQNMAELDVHAQAITRIMTVISDIADQTNLLALNAAIEAARAGEAGRGFAVVADEVRKLAEKTMASTVEVGNAIRAIQGSAAANSLQVDSTVDSITDTTQRVSASGSALEAILTMMDGATDKVRNIATASEQQTHTSEQITQAVTEVHSISDATLNAMRDAEDAVEALAAQGRQLEQLVVELKKA